MFASNRGRERATQRTAKPAVRSQRFGPSGPNPVKATDRHVAIPYGNIGHENFSAAPTKSRCEFPGPRQAVNVFMWPLLSMCIHSARALCLLELSHRDRQVGPMSRLPRTEVFDPHEAPASQMVTNGLEGGRLNLVKPDRESSPGPSGYRRLGSIRVDTIGFED